MYLQDNRSKALFHLNRAEYWQSKVDGFERAALAKAQRQEEGRMARSDGSKIDPEYLAGTLLENNFRYKAAVANRNAHQRQAEIYALAAMAAVGETDWVRTEDGLVRVTPEQ